MLSESLEQHHHKTWDVFTECYKRWKDVSLNRWQVTKTMKPAELLSSHIIRQTYGSGIWITLHSSISVTTHQHDKGDDMSIWFLYEVLTRTSRWDHYGRDQDPTVKSTKVRRTSTSSFRFSKCQEVLKQWTRSFTARVPGIVTSPLDGVVCRTASTNHHHLVTKLNMVEVVFLGPKLAEMALTRMTGRQMVQKDDVEFTLTIFVGNSFSWARSWQLCFFYTWFEQNFLVVLLFLLKVSRPHSSNCHECDVMCRYNTCLYARIRAFFSYALHTGWLHVWPKIV